MRRTASSPVTGPATTFLECSLLAMLASGFLAVLGSGELDLPTTLLTACALLLRVFMIAGVVRFKIPHTLVSVIAGIFVLFFAADYWWFSRSFMGATVHLIFFVAVAKLLTAQTTRDYFYLKIIATLELLAAALLSTHLSFFLFLTLFVLSAIGALASGEIVRSLERVKAVSPIRSRLVQGRLGLMSAALFAGILLMTAGLFFVLPRTARAAMQRFTPPRYHLPGFGSEVTLGDLGELKQNSIAVMHVRSYTDRSLDGLHWRGSTLSHFDGSRWSSPFLREERLTVEDDKLLLPRVPGTRPGVVLGYSVELSDLAPDAIFFAGLPQTISIQLRTLFRSPSGTLRAPRLGLPVLQYGAYSLLESDGLPTEPPARLTFSEEREFLELPALDPRIRALAQGWTGNESDPRRMAQTLESHLQHDFGYTLEMLSAPVPDPLAHFCFERKKGHCEYFASSMAVMLRTIGIPSRVVTGFYGGIFNSISGWQVLRASDAHSWVEAWLPQRGWTTFDPTPADPAAGEPPELLTKAALLFDAADQFWRDWVLSYDFDRQVMLAAQVQTAGRVWQFGDWAPWSGVGSIGTLMRDNPGWWIVIVIGVSFVILVLVYGPSWVAWWNRRSRLARAQRGEAQASDATLIYERMLSLLERGGWKRPPWLTPQEFARTLPASSELSLLVEDLTASYNQVRFGQHQDVAPRMARLLQRIETLLV